MRIDFLAVDELPSRAANVVYVMAMVDAFARLGHEVRVTFPRSLGSPRGAILDALRREHDVDPRVRLEFLPRIIVRGRLGGSYFVAAALASRIRSPDLVVTQTPRIADLARRANQAVVLDLHASLVSSRSVRAMRRLAREELGVAYVFNTRRLKAIVESEVGTSLEPSAVRPNGVRLERFVLGSAANSRRPAAGDRAFRVVHAGHAYAGRGIEVFLEVARRIPDATFVQIGGEPRDVELHRARVRGDGLANVVFVPFVPPRDLPGELLAADVLVMPYTADAVASDGRTKTMEYASPMKMIDFMAAGRPIVASSFPGVAETLLHGENALLVAPSSVDELERAIRRLRDEPELASRLGRSARVAAESLGWESRASAILAVAREAGVRARDDA